MKQLVRLVIVAFVAAAIATIIAQRERLRQIDREQLATQLREAIQSLRDRSQRRTELPAVEDVEMELDTAVEEIEEAPEDRAAAAEDAAAS